MSTYTITLRATTTYHLTDRVLDALYSKCETEPDLSWTNPEVSKQFTKDIVEAKDVDEAFVKAKEMFDHPDGSFSFEKEPGEIFPDYGTAYVIHVHQVEVENVADPTDSKVFTGLNWLDPDPSEVERPTHYIPQLIIKGAQ